MAIISQNISAFGALVLIAAVDKTSPASVLAFQQAWEAFNTQLKNTTVSELNTFGTQTNAVRDEVNTLRNTVVAKEALVSPHYTAIDAVYANATNINSVATTIVPNITEILLADTNAATATTKAQLSADYAEKMALPVETGTYSSKEYAIGDLTATGGSAKAWTQDTASPDGTTSKSAKTLAAEAAASVVLTHADVVTCTNLAGAFVSTSTTSVLIGTGSKSFTIQTGEQYTTGAFISIAYTTTPTNFMHGQVTSYNSGTGALVVDVQSIGGSGTFALWSISLSGARGAVGASGATTVINNTLTSTSTTEALSANMGKTLQDTKAPIEDILGANIASAATTTIGTSGSGDTIHITGTTTITSFGISATGTRRTIIFDGALTVTHNATSMILPAATSITTAAGDIMEVVCEDGVNRYWRCTSYVKNSISVLEQGYLDGVTSPIQTQLDSKLGATLAVALNTARATVASHATTADIWGALGNQIDWTGTATTTIFPNAPQAGAERTLICAGACSFTAGANMLIDGVASGSTVTCAANDTVIVRAVSITQVKLSRIKNDGTAQVASKDWDILYNYSFTNVLTQSNAISAGYKRIRIVLRGVLTSNVTPFIRVNGKSTGYNGFVQNVYNAATRITNWSNNAQAQLSYQATYPTYSYFLDCDIDIYKTNLISIRTSASTYDNSTTREKDIGEWTLDTGGAVTDINNVYLDFTSATNSGNILILGSKNV